MSIFFTVYSDFLPGCQAQVSHVLGNQPFSVHVGPRHHCHRCWPDSGKNWVLVCLIFQFVWEQLSENPPSWPFLMGAPIFLAVGSGLLFTVGTSTTSTQLIGFQILTGIGTGMGLQNSLIAIQSEFKDTPKLLGQAMSMASFGQFFGGTIGLGVAEPVLASELSKYLLIYAPEAPADIVKESPTAIYTELQVSMIPGVVKAYSLALRVVFVLGVPVAGLALLAAMFINNIQIVKSAPLVAIDPPLSKNDKDREKGE